jgi:hypothetical protein
LTGGFTNGQLPLLQAGVTATLEVAKFDYEEVR